MYETPAELARLQDLLDASMEAAGPHLRSVMTEDRRLDAPELCRRMDGMRLFVVATVGTTGRPLSAPVDGYLLHGDLHFSSARNSVKMAHLAARPALSATHLPSEELVVTVHGRAELYELSDPSRGELRRAMLDWYVARQGPAFEEWLDATDALGARVVADRLYAFSAP